MVKKRPVRYSPVPFPPSPCLELLKGASPWRDEERQARDCVVEGGLSSLLILEKVGAEPVPRILRVMTVVGADLVRLSCCVMMVAARTCVGEGWGWGRKDGG